MTAMSIPVLGVKLWNFLNESLATIMSKYTFKRHYINIHDYNDKLTFAVCTYLFVV